MAQERIYANGIRTFPKHEKAPDFVLGTLVIEPKTLHEWLTGEGNQYLTEYKGNKQLRLQMLKAKDGSVSIQVDTYKPKEKDVPF